METVVKKRKRRTKAEMEAMREEETKETSVSYVPKAAVHKGSDAVLKINLSMPDREPMDFQIRILNVRGSTLGKTRNPDGFFEKIRETIKKEFPGVV